jgi:O-antigen/teichoic acid export membrane protein
MFGKDENSVAVPDSGKLFRNTGYNLFTQGILIILAIWAIPILVHRLGDDKFGILALLWAVVGYFSLLDLGVSRANTKFLSESLALDDKKLSSTIAWNSITLSAGLGVVSMVVVIAATPYLLVSVFKVSPGFYKDASDAFLYASLSVPFMLIFGSIKGIQMAFLRFDLTNTFQGGMSALQWIGSIVLVWFGLGLKEIMLLTFLLRIISAAVAFSILPRLIPNFYDSINLWDGLVMRKMLKFGGWVSVSQIISPLFVYLDRILIGVFLSLSAVAFYSVPQEAIGRLLIIPASFSIVLFPIFSGQNATELNQRKSGDLYYLSLKYLTLLMLPMTIGIIAYAQDILHLWVGPRYGGESAFVLQIIAIGFLFNSVGQVPNIVLQAFGRPDLTAKFHLLELPIMIILNIILIPRVGIIGAGIAWSFRVILDAALVFFSAQRLMNASTRAENKSMYFGALRYEIILAICITGMLLLIDTILVKMAISIVLIIGYTLWIWFRVFNDADRRYFIQLRSQIVR